MSDFSRNITLHELITELSIAASKDGLKINKIEMEKRTYSEIHHVQGIHGPIEVSIKDRLSFTEMKE